MSVGTYDIFATTMTSFERAFQVRHIATFDLSKCDANEDAQQVFIHYPDFDQIPVVENDRVIGILEQSGEILPGPVRSQMRSIDESVLIAADEPINRILPLLSRPQSYRLVLEGTRINGVVTRSDVLKLPVRLYTFGIVTHLETVMAQIVEQRRSGTWLDLLKESRKKKLEGKQAELQRRRVNPPLLELTDFCDKRDMVRSILGLTNKFKDELEGIEELRNQVAHAGNYAANNAEFATFLNRLEQAHHWIKELYQQLR